MSSDCIVIGASHAAAQLVMLIRKEGWQGRILVIGDEPYLPYQHPPLSKDFFAGDKSMDDIYIRDATAYEAKDVEFLFNTRVTAIDRNNKQITLDNGDTLNYAKLALTVGARVRKAGLPGEDQLSGIHYLRTADDALSIQQALPDTKHAVVIGGGYIGLELAASMRKAGVEVTVLEMQERVLARVTAPELSEFYTRIHGEEGVKVLTGMRVASLEGHGHVQSVSCDDGQTFSADLVVIGIGVIPNTELAYETGLEVGNGIVVNEFAQTSDPDIVAAGDCTFHPNAMLGTSLRLESVPNAMEQSKAAAASICGKQKAYSALPWFWSDQYDLKLQIAGLNQGYEQVIIRGDNQSSRSFAAFYIKDGKVIAVDCVNRPQEFMVTRMALSNGKTLDIDKLADESIPPKELVSTI